jgi:hypothetical protein
MLLTITLNKPTPNPSKEGNFAFAFLLLGGEKEVGTFVL